MKKLYTLFAAAIVCTLPVRAQFTMLQKYHEPSAAAGFNKADMVRYDSIGALPNTAGMSQTWDFSAMLISSSISTRSFIAASSAPHATVFPTANIAAMMNGNVYNYYKSDTVAKTFELVGSVNGATVITYSDPKMIYKWDITYGSTWTDTYMMSDLTNTVSGTYTVSATGNGNLMLVGGPSKTFSNVMQLTSHDMMTWMTATDTIQMHNTAYNYYSSLNRYPLLSVSYNRTSTDDTTTMTNSIYVNYLEAVGVNENHLDEFHALYPNPANDHIVVRLDNPQMDPVSITIQSITGAIVKERNAGSDRNLELSVDVSDLPAGVYIVRASSGRISSARKLIIE